MQCPHRSPTTPRAAAALPPASILPQAPALRPAAAPTPAAVLLPASFLLLLSFALPGCPAPTGPAESAGQQAPARPPRDVRADLAAIARLRDEYVAAHNAGDLDRIMALWADDAIFMAADEPTIYGKAAIREHIEKILDQIPARVALSLEETRIADDWAFDRGVETVTMETEASGQSVTMRVKYICILQRQADGSWRFARYIYNIE
jgi:uncharacterized protein (TIGR02246 family)